jgi:hypothetical protein
MGWFSKKKEAAIKEVAIRKLESMLHHANREYHLRIDFEPFRTLNGWGWVDVGINHNGSYKSLGREGIAPLESYFDIIDNVCLNIIEEIRKKNVGACIDSIGMPWKHSPKAEPVSPVLSGIGSDANIAMTGPHSGPLPMKTLDPKKVAKARKKIKKSAAKRLKAKRKKG